MSDGQAWQRLPIDPDVDASGTTRSLPGAPRMAAGVAAAVFAGGCVGGYARYALTDAWGSAPYAFPWATFAVNVAGAFVLAVVVVAAARPGAPRLLRPLLGTGFCGALTTFSAVAVAVARMLAHHHVATAVVYAVVTVAASLTAVWGGLVVARAVVADDEVVA